MTTTTVKTITLENAHEVRIFNKIMQFAFDNQGALYSATVKRHL